MSGLTRFDFYPRDWFLDTRELTDRAKGCYIDLLAAIYNRGGPLPYDEKYLVQLCGYRNVRSLRLVLDELLKFKKFTIVETDAGKVLVNNRAMEEIAKADKKMEQRSKGGKSKSARNGADMGSIPSPLHAETESGFVEKQEVNPKYPSPSPSPSQKRKKKYAFAGEVIRLNRKDFDEWQAIYFNIPNFMATLKSRDIWLADQPERDRRNWFRSTSKYLENLDAKFATGAGQPKDPDAEYFKELDEGIIH